jgi:hypothetical protein
MLQIGNYNLSFYGMVFCGIPKSMSSRKAVTVFPVLGKNSAKARDSEQAFVGVPRIGCLQHAFKKILALEPCNGSFLVSLKFRKWRASTARLARRITEHCGDPPAPMGNHLGNFC